MLIANKRQSLPGAHRENGFTLIELMIVVSIIAILLALAMPVYSNYTIRSKISEGLSVAASAKTSVASTCIENPNITALTNDAAGYNFTAGTDMDDYVASVQASGNCSEPLITITTMHTGQLPDPILLLQGLLNSADAKVEWRCHSNNTPNFLLPATCRSS